MGRFVADSLLEEAVSSEPVSEAKFPASREFTGNFIESGLRGASTAAKTRVKPDPYGPIPYASEQGIFYGLAGNLNRRSGKFPPSSGNPALVRYLGHFALPTNPIYRSPSERSRPFAEKAKRTLPDARVAESSAGHPELRVARTRTEQRGFIRDVILAGRHAAACLMRRPQQVLGPIAAAKSSGAALSRGNAGVDIELDPVEGSFEAGELVGPRVRIHFPPAGSLVRTRTSCRAMMARGWIASRIRRSLLSSFRIHPRLQRPIERPTR
jgi:hypothetical protein